MDAGLRMEFGALVRVVILAGRSFTVDVEAREYTLSAVEADSLEVFEVRIDRDLSSPFQAASQKIDVQLHLLMRH